MNWVDTFCFCSVYINISDQLNSGIICPTQENILICNNNTAAELSFVQWCDAQKFDNSMNMQTALRQLSDGGLNNELISSLIHLESSQLIYWYIFFSDYECFTNTSFVQ